MSKFYDCANCGKKTTAVKTTELGGLLFNIEQKPICLICWELLIKFDWVNLQKRKVVGVGRDE